MPFDLLPGQVIYLAAALLVAAFIRGFSGFGFSAIFIICAALVTNPLPLIPVVFACEILMTIFQARDIGPHIDWRRTGALLLGAAIAIVPAVWIMARLDAGTARLVISSLVLGLSLLLLSGWKLTRPIGPGGHVAVGLIAGGANSAGVGGLPVAACLSAQPISAATFRATMIIFLTGLDLLTLPVMAANGLISAATLPAIAMAFPVLGLGIWAGSRSFRGSNPEEFRYWVIGLLALLALVNIGRTLL